MFAVVAGSLFYCLSSRLPQLGGPGPRIYIPQEQGGPVLTPGTGFPFRRLLRLAGFTVEVFESASTRATEETIQSQSLYTSYNCICFQYDYLQYCI
jgi:hypothetical protein